MGSHHSSSSQRSKLEFHCISDPLVTYCVLLRINRSTLVLTYFLEIHSPYPPFSFSFFILLYNITIYIIYVHIYNLYYNRRSVGSSLFAIDAIS